MNLLSGSLVKPRLIPHEEDSLESDHRLLATRLEESELHVVENCFFSFLVLFQCFLTYDFLFLQRVCDFIYDIIREILSEVRIGFVEPHGVGCHLLSSLGCVLYSAISRVFCLHKREKAKHDLVDAPSWRPELRMIVTE